MAAGYFDLAARKQRAAEIWNSVSWEELAAFIGPRSENFRKDWEKFHTGAKSQKRTALSRCWPAFFFGFAWFFWRRQWLAGTAFIIAPIMIGISLPVHGSGIGLAVAQSILAKPLYVNQSVRKIAALKGEHPEGLSSAMLRRAGGTSVAGLVLGIGLWLIIATLILLPLLANKHH